MSKKASKAATMSQVDRDSILNDAIDMLIGKQSGKSKAERDIEKQRRDEIKQRIGEVAAQYERARKSATAATRPKEIEEQMAALEQAFNVLAVALKTLHPDTYDEIRGMHTPNFKNVSADSSLRNIIKPARRGLHISRMKGAGLDDGTDKDRRNMEADLAFAEVTALDPETIAFPFAEIVSARGAGGLHIVSYYHLTQTMARHLRRARKRYVRETKDAHGGVVDPGGQQNSYRQRYGREKEGLVLGCFHIFEYYKGAPTSTKDGAFHKFVSHVLDYADPRSTGKAVGIHEEVVALIRRYKQARERWAMNAPQALAGDKA